MTIIGTFTLEIGPDKPYHATLTLNCPGRDPISDKWFDFIYCNDLMWRCHAASWGPQEVVAHLAMLKPELYQHFLHKNGPDHYLIGD